MARHQQIKAIISQLETLDNVALDSLLQLLKSVATKQKQKKRKRSRQTNIHLNEESRIWLPAKLVPSLAPYDWEILTQQPWDLYVISRGKAG